MSVIGFLVDRLHVGTSDRAIVREFRDRCRNGRWTREQRHAIYREALERHHEHKALVQDFRL